MDPTDDAFFREAASQIRALNDGLIAVERGGDREAAVGELFRVAHSLKGSCRTQGLAEAGELAHALEDVLGAMRRGDVEPTAALIDEALATVDLLEATVEAAATGTEADGDVDAARASLRSVLDEERSRTASGDASSEDLAADTPDLDDGWKPDDGGLVDDLNDDDLSDDVVAALEETTEFDDVDALLEEADGAEADADVDGWGLLDDGTDADRSSEAVDEAETPANPSTFFEETKAELDAEGNIDSLQEDIDDVEFGEFDDDDNYTIDELIELEPDEDALGSEETALGEDTEPGVDGASPASSGGIEPSPPDAGPLGSRAESPTATETDAATESDEPPAEQPASVDQILDRLADVGEGTTDSPVTAEADASGDADADDDADADVDSDAGGETTDDRDDQADSPGAPDSTPAETATEEAENDAFVFGNASEDGDDSAETASVDESDASDESVPTLDDDSARAEAGGDDGATADASEPAPKPDEELTVDADDASTASEERSAPEADAGSVPDPDSVPDDDLVPDAGSLPDPDSVPDADSLPDADVGVDLPDDVDAGPGDDWTDESEMSVSVDEGMAEFESRFDGLIGGGPDAGSDQEESVFRSAVDTIEASRLDADEFPAADAAGEPEAADEFDSLQSMTVDVETADRLLNVAEELSLTHLRLEEAVGPETDDAIREEVANLLGVVAEHRRTVMDVRLMPLEIAVDALPRTVRDVARSQDKEVELVVEDAAVELDRSIIDRLRDPLVHIARNAVDHGIEPPEEREAAGKPREGTIEIRAERAGDEVVIEVSDDGRGIRPGELRRRAVDAGVLTLQEADQLDDSETYDLLFEPGFSTSEEVTDVSGRGVGMDVVNRTTADLNGSVTVDSVPGEGTTVRLTVPVSIALTEVLFVEAGGETFGIPMSVVEQITGVPEVESVDGRDVVRRSALDLVGGLPEGVEAEDAYPFVRLESALDLPEGGERSEEQGRSDEHGHVVWIRGEDELAVQCDRIVASQEVVVRPYGDLLRDVPGVSGATTLGDGEAVNVLEVSSI